MEAIIAPIIEKLKKHPFLYLALLIVVLIFWTFNVEVISSYIEEKGWCLKDSSVCQINIRLWIIFIVILVGIVFQFIIPKLVQQYKKWVDQEEVVDFDIADGIRSPYYVLFARSRVFPFIVGGECVIEVFPEINSLSDSELRNTYSTNIRLPINKIIWLGTTKRINTFTFGKNGSSFSLFGGEQYSTNPLFNSGNHIFRVKISGRNIFLKRVSHERYIIAKYRGDDEQPEISIRKFYEIEKVVRDTITRYDKRFEFKFGFGK